MWAFRISNSQTYLDLIQIRHSRLNVVIINNMLTVLLHPQAISKTHAPVISLQWSRVTSSPRPHGTPSPLTHGVAAVGKNLASVAILPKTSEEHRVQSQESLSSGCIRLSQTWAMFQYIL